MVWMLLGAPLLTLETPSNERTDGGNAVFGATVVEHRAELTTKHFAVAVAVVTVAVIITVPVLREVVLQSLDRSTHTQRKR